jgi:hypothetical protein
MQIVDWLRRIDAASRVDREYDEKKKQWVTLKDGAAQSIFTARDVRSPIAVPKPLGVKAFEVIGIPLAAPGFYVTELASPRLGAALFGIRKPYYVRTATLVTNLSVHVKLGRESSLVWVTRLADAKPVAGAQVIVRDCKGRSYFQGRSDASGHRAHRVRAAGEECVAELQQRRTAGILRHRARRRRSRVRVHRLGRGHCAVALQRADRQLQRALRCALRCSIARSCAPARRCR